MSSLPQSQLQVFPQTQPKWTRNLSGKRLKIEQEHDRISELPIPVRHHILSLIPLHEAIKTSVLSRSWRDAWLSLPSLDLNSALFYQIKKRNEKNKLPDSIIKCEQLFLYFVDRLLTRRCGMLSDALYSLSVKRLHLFIPEFIRTDPEKSRLDKWLYWAVHNFHVKTLVFTIDKTSPSGGDTNLYEFPMPVFDYGKLEITELILRGCVKIPPIQSGWSNLKTLGLTCVSLDQETIDSITTYCPLIEILIFSDCHGQYHSLNASSLKKLVTVSIIGSVVFRKIDIHSVNLRHFKWAAQGPTELLLNDFGTISNGLQTLYIHYDSALTSNWLERNLPKLSRLLTLDLAFCNLVKQINVSSTSLTSIVISRCTQLHDVKIDSARLEVLRYNHLGTSIPSLQLKAPALQKACVGLCVPLPPIIGDLLFWYEELIKFVNNFKGSKELELQDFTLSKYAMIPQNIRAHSGASLQSAKHVSLFFHSKSSVREDKNLVDLVDTLLWLCPRLETILIRYWRHQAGNDQGRFTKLLKFEYIRPNNVLEKCHHCASLPIQCWWHCLERVTIENIKGTGKNLFTIQARVKTDEELRVYFENVAKNDRKILVKVI